MIGVLDFVLGAVPDDSIVEVCLFGEVAESEPDDAGIDLDGGSELAVVADDGIGWVLVTELLIERVGPYVLDGLDCGKLLA